MNLYYSNKTNIGKKITELARICMMVMILLIFFKNHIAACPLANPLNGEPTWCADCCPFRGMPVNIGCEYTIKWFIDYATKHLAEDNGIHPPVNTVYYNAEKKYFYINFPFKGDCVEMRLCPQTYNYKDIPPNGHIFDPYKDNFSLDIQHPKNPQDINLLWDTLKKLAIQKSGSGAQIIKQSMTNTYVSVVVDVKDDVGMVCWWKWYRIYYDLSHFNDDCKNKDSDGDEIPDCIDPNPNDPNPDDEDINDQPSIGDEENGDDDKYEEGQCPKLGNPISIYNGNKLEQMTDFHFNTPFQGGLSLRRAYNSRSKEITPSGFGWTNSYSTKLIYLYNYSQEIPHLKIIDNTGRGIYFMWNGAIFEGRNKEKSTIEKTADRYIWKRTDNTVYTFDMEGKLLEMQDKNGNKQTLSYNSTGSLLSVTDSASGRSLSFHYDSVQNESNNRIEYITGPVTTAVPDGIWVRYGYDANNNLTSVIYPDGSGIDYIYGDANDPHNLTEKRDKEGHVISKWTYDAYDRAISSVNREGKNVSIDYTFPKLVKVTDAYNVNRNFGIDKIAGRKRITTITGENNGCSSCGSSGYDIIRSAYDTDRNLVEQQHRNGRIDRFQDYDIMGRAKTKIYNFGAADQRTETYTYHPTLDDTLSKTEPSILGTGNKVTIWDYDSDGNSTPNENPTNRVYRKIERGFTTNASGEIVPYEYITKYEYNTKGQVTAVDGPIPGDQDKTVYTYDPATGDLLTVSNSVTGTVTYTYDLAGNVKSVTDPNNLVTWTTYDGRNRVLTASTDGKTTSKTYTLSGDIKTVTDAENRTTTYAYESVYGRLDTVTDPMGNYHKYQYDALGHVIDDSIYNPSNTLQKQTRFSYDGPDKAGKLWKQINADNTYTEFTYDDSGNKTAMKSPAGKTTAYGYDTENRLKTVTLPDSTVTTYGYDIKGNMTTVTDAAQHSTVYTFDDLGRTVKTVSPDTGTTRYSYSETGQLKTKTLNSGKVTTYEYDSLGRQTKIHYADSSKDETFIYDQGTNNKGRLTGKTGPGWSLNYGYNTLGRVTSESRVIGTKTFTTQYGYDNTGILTSMTYPDSRTVAYTLNPDGQYMTMTTAKSGTTKTLVTNATYKPFGPYAGYTYGNGITLSQTYDTDYRLTGITAGSVYGTTYTRDADSQITGITNTLDATRNQTFIYDDQYRLTTATGIYGRISYAYDVVGNRLASETASQTEAYAYVSGTNTISSVTAVIGGPMVKTYAHDADGNILTHVVEKTNPPALATSDYLYTSDGLRLTKTAASAVTVYHYDLGGNLVGESDAAGNSFKSYLYMGGLRIAAVATDGSICYYHNNHLETPEKMTSEAGAVVWKADYKPFGEVTIDPSSTVENNFRFPGQFFDKETGFYYNWNRYYDPSTGRYLTADPIGLKGGINLYAYTRNNSINRFDPWGLCDCSHILEDALNMNNDSGYGYLGNKGPGPNKNKCNTFVDDVLKRTGVNPRRHFGFGGPISAGTWADPQADIPHFPVVQTPQSGDIVAIAHNYADASGHVAIVDIPFLSTIGAGRYSSHTTGWPWDLNYPPQGTLVYRRCTCN